MGFKVKSEELLSRLNYTYVWFDGDYYYAVNSGGNLKGYPVGVKNGTAVTLDITHPKFSHSNVMGGMCTDKNGEVAFLRLAGPDYHNTGTGCFSKDWCKSAKFSVPEYSDPAILNCLMGKTLKFQEAVDLLTSNKARAAAFHRNFAITRTPGYHDMVVVHKNKEIGTYDPAKKKFSLRQSPILTLIRRQLEAVAKE